MKIRLTKKGKIILFAILGIVVLSSGGFLLWRVLQEDTVAPTDSDAGNNDTGECVSTCSCYVCEYLGNYFLLTNGECRTGQTKVNSCTEFNKINGSLPDCYRHDCGNGNWIYSTIYSASEACKDCSWDDEDPSGECDSGAACPACRWPNVAFCDNNQDGGTCICKRWDSFDNPGCNNDQPFSCNATCPSGQVECSAGETGCTEVRKNCVCPECNNKTYDIVRCKTVQEPTNTCEGGNWENPLSDSYEYGASINPIVINTTDKDGLGQVTLTVNGVTIDECTVDVGGGISASNVGVTCYEKDGTDINIYLDPGQQNIAPGTYNIDISWKDGAGIGGNNCQLEDTFTINEQPVSCGDGNLDQGEECEDGDPSGVSCTWSECNQDSCLCPDEPDEECGDGILTEGEQCELGNPTGYQCLWDQCNQTSCVCEEQENPDWTITKTASEECIEEGGETYAKATYTITITNVGEGEGTIDKIEDTLDEKVLEEYLNEISNQGAYASGIITWDLEGEDEIFSSEESMQFTYYIQVPDDAFGTYENTATAYPGQGDTFSDDESIELICQTAQEIPETGIFDSVIARIAAGIVLILIGLNWSKLNYTVNEMVSDRRIKKFERKVAKS